MFPEILIIIILLGALLYLMISSLGSKGKEKYSNYEAQEDEIPDDRKPCPMCEQKLYRGERVHSVIYNQGEDRLMNIFGCPWCYKNHPAGYREPQRDRHCPSCGVHLKEGSFAVARVFERPGRKTHIHVLGCPVCRHSR